jgi:hypothetical protein
MKRRYINFKKIYAWGWHRCELCNRFFKWENGWYGWHDTRPGYAINVRIKRYVCETCCYSEDTADNFFAVYPWNQPSRTEWPSVLNAQSSHPALKPKSSKKAASGEGHPNRYDILKEEEPNG